MTEPKGIHEWTWRDDLVYGLVFFAKVVAGFGLAALVGAAIYFSIGPAYQSLDQAGWITHNHDTPVWIQGDWMVGEYRDCGMLTTTSPAGTVLSQAVKAELPRLFCGKNWDGEGIAEFFLAMPDYTSATDSVWGRADWKMLDRYFHTLPVSYYGRIDRPDSVFVWWRCQRNESALTCKALN